MSNYMKTNLKYWDREYHHTFFGKKKMKLNNIFLQYTFNYFFRYFFIPRFNKMI